MIDEAVDTLGDEATPFTQALVDSLDPHSSRGFGARHAQNLEAFGPLITDTDAIRVQRWGALCLVGALAMTYEPSLHDNPTRSPQDYRAQASSHIARGVLQSVLHADHIGKDMTDIARTFLASPNLSTEDLATQLVMLDFPRRHAESEPAITKEKIDSEMDEDEIVTGCSVSETLAFALALSPEAQSRLGKMDWLADTDMSDVSGRRLYQNGEEIAVIVDLTAKHPRFEQYLKELETDPKLGERFWGRLAVSLTRYIANDGRGKRLHGTKVPIAYMTTGRSSEDIIRAYYTTLGKNPNNKPIIGLIAAFRTKGPQRAVIKLLTDRDGRKAPE